MLSVSRAQPATGTSSCPAAIAREAACRVICSANSHRGREINHLCRRGGAGALQV